MTVLYPRLPLATAEQLYLERDSLAPAADHRGQIFAPVGGRRATSTEVAGVAERTRALAREFGFPGSTTGSIIDFDRQCARLLVEEMTLTWSEAASPEIWSFMALVALPDVTRWRWPDTQNRERWIASDLTRHTWGRAWWRGTVFAGRPDLFDALSESDLNQLLERRVIGGDVRLVTGAAQALLESAGTEEIERRALFRDAAARLRRRIAFVDPRALDDDEVLAMCRAIVTESAHQLAAGR